MRSPLRPLLIATFLLVMRGALADPVTGLTTFTANSPARATEVNANFTAVKTAVDNSHQRIVTLEGTSAEDHARITALESALETSRQQIATLQAELEASRQRIGTIETQLTSTPVQALLAFAPHLSVMTLNSRPTIRLSGANLQIVNGTNDTYRINGTGNLVLGYDEARPTTSAPECSLGVSSPSFSPVETEAQCTAARGTWAIDHKTGSHNLIVGAQHNYPSAGTFIAGAQNTASSVGASVAGGLFNRAGGIDSAVSGGSLNRALGFATSVTGGAGNRAVGNQAAVIGGNNNRANGTYSSITGGHDGQANGESSHVGGGQFNFAEGHSTNVSGGSSNVASGAGSSVLGGTSRIATGDFVTIPALP
jgi:trimeric autotransporter adhesin